MSSDVRITRRAALLGLLPLAACGFAPVYGDAGNLRGRISYQTPGTVTGFALRDQLVTRLGVTGDVVYDLAIDLAEEEVAAAVTRDGDTTRISRLGQANWRLTRGGALIASGSETTFASYSATSSTVSTQAAADDAGRRLAVALADLVVAQVILAAP